MASAAACFRALLTLRLAPGELLAGLTAIARVGWRWCGCAPAAWAVPSCQPRTSGVGSPVGLLAIGLLGGERKEGAAEARDGGRRVAESRRVVEESRRWGGVAWWGEPRADEGVECARAWRAGELCGEWFTREWWRGGVREWWGGGDGRRGERRAGEDEATEEPAGGAFLSAFLQDHRPSTWAHRLLGKCGGRAASALSSSSVAIGACTYACIGVCITGAGVPRECWPSSSAGTSSPGTASTAAVDPSTAEAGGSSGGRHFVRWAGTGSRTPATMLTV